MARLIVVTPNPAVDVTYHVPGFEVGSTVRVSEVSRRPGGKGLNVVRVLRTLGETAVAVVPLGGAAGQWVSSTMDAEGLVSEIVTVAGETRSTVTIVDPVGHPTVFSEAGPSLSADESDRLIEAAVRQCEPGCVLVISGSLPRGTGPAWLGRIVVAVREAGARVLVDTSGPALLAAAEAGADLLKPNAAEAVEATGALASGDNRLADEPAGRKTNALSEGREASALSDPDNRLSREVESGDQTAQLAAAVAHLQKLGASTIVISQGADGLVAFAPDGTTYQQAAVQGVSGNPTGAGDAATAGLALAWAKGEDLEKALRRAAVLGAAAVKQPTAGEVDLADVQAFEEQL